MKTVLLLLFLPAIIWFGISATLSDIRTGKVRNSLIRKGYFYGLAVYCLLILWTVARKYSVMLAIHAGRTYYLSLSYFPDFIINSILALAVGILLWKLDFWAAGDAKLFALFSFLLPLTVYSRERILYFPSFILLFNIYTLAFFYLLLAGVFRLRIKGIRLADLLHWLKEKAGNIGKKLKAKLQISNIPNFFNFILLYSIIFSVLNLFKIKIKILGFSLSSHLLLYLALFLIYRPLSLLLDKHKKMNLVLLPLLITASFLIPGFWTSFSTRLNPFIRFFSGFFVFLMVIRTGAKLASGQTDVRKIKVQELQPHMILGDASLSLLQKEKDFCSKEIGPLYFDGLSPEQIEKIKVFFQNKNMEEVEVCRTFPFAPFIFSGAVITVLLQGSLFKWIMRFLQK
ncbi:MAG: hypothetical protein PHF84_07670 [bacterium]|nr:hypothetical protein [bacterium]